MHSFRCLWENDICLLLLALNAHPDYSLIAAANRDEHYGRPASPAAYWPDHPSIVAGRDLEKGGTWLGVTVSGRFAALTNFRDPSARKTNPRSRGHLVAGFLAGDVTAGAYLAQVAATADAYDPFNLIVAADGVCASLGSRERQIRVLSPGIYGLSNHELDTPWPKVVRAKAEFARLISGRPTAAQFLSLLSDRSVAPDSDLPRTGLSLELERALSPVFIASPGALPQYGTRASTAVLFRRGGGIDFVERSFGENAILLGEVAYRLPGLPSVGGSGGANGMREEWTKSPT